MYGPSFICLVGKIDPFACFLFELDIEFINEDCRLSSI